MAEIKGVKKLSKAQLKKAIGAGEVESCANQMTSFNPGMTFRTAKDICLISIASALEAAYLK